SSRRRHTRWPRDWSSDVYSSDLPNPQSRIANPTGVAMRLERLEINGFKSFSDRSELAFDKGVTAIVGPNGCGKSNVADAITWVKIGRASCRERVETAVEAVTQRG